MVDFMSHCCSVFVQVMVLIRNVNVIVLRTIFEFANKGRVEKLGLIPCLAGISESSKIGKNSIGRYVNFGIKTGMYMSWFTGTTL